MTELPYRQLPLSKWNTRVVARIHMGHVDVQARLHLAFEHIVDLHVLVLELRSGLEVTLVAPWWPGSEDVALLSRDPLRSPDEVLAEFLAATGFRLDDVTLKI